MYRATITYPTFSMTHSAWTEADLEEKISTELDRLDNEPDYRAAMTRAALAFGVPDEVTVERAAAPTTDDLIAERERRIAQHERKIGFYKRALGRIPTSERMKNRLAVEDEKIAEHRDAIVALRAA